MSETVAGKAWGRPLRIIFAFALPAAVAGLVGSLILSFTLFTDLVSNTADEVQSYRINHTGVAVMGAAFGGTWGQLATLVIGLPAHIWLMHYTRQRLWMYLLVGVSAGVIFGLVIVWPLIFGFTPPPVTGLAWIAVASANAGAAAGLTFWLIRRPDKDISLNQSGPNATSA